jgi:pimeloyl-ACP methyl ester carboxylesterase
MSGGHEVATVEVNGGRLEYELAGAGPAVAFLHPGLWDRRAWDDQFDVFAERHRVVRHDARGYGRSSRPEPGRPYSHVEDLGAVLDAAGIDRAALVGCSMGGGTALHFALVHPDRVTALVLVASGFDGFEGTPEEEERWNAEWSGLESEIAAATEAGELERAQDLRLRLWAPLGTDDPRGRRIREIAFDNLHEIEMDEGGARGIDPPAIDRLEEVSAPTLVLPADHDPPWLPRMAEVLADRIPAARLVRIRDVDHVVNMRKPEEFSRVVLDFLAEVL